MKAQTRTVLATVVLGTTALALGRTDAQAADHSEAPLTAADAAADITDFFAWHDGGTRMIAAIAFAGGDIPGSEGTYDSAVLYGVHIDIDADNVADKTVWARFGRSEDGEWGVKFEGIPGADAEVVGRVNTVIEAGGGLRAFAGVRDDPFFFDSEGFEDTLASGSVSFDSARDTFAGSNVTMVVFQMDEDAATDGANVVHMWATTARREDAR